MKILSGAVNVCADTEGQKLWPVIEVPVEAYCYDYLAVEDAVVTIIVNHPIETLTRALDMRMKEAATQALKAKEVQFDSQSIRFAGPTYRSIIDIALTLAAASS